MINHMTLQGRLVADPELRYTQSQIPICSFRVAWSEKYKEVETKLFLACTAWRGMGEMVSKYFHKGQEIAVEGKLSTRDWQDRDGSNRQSIEMTVDRVHFCGPKRDGQSGGYGGGGYAPAGPPVSVPGPGPEPGEFSDLEGPDGDLPF